MSGQKKKQNTQGVWEEKSELKDVSMRYVSLFAGIGGFDLALNRLDHECVYVNEWDKYAAQIYEKNFGHKPDTRSITDVPESEIPRHDILVGGFPCQAFSVAGRRRGFADTRGTLFFEICRIVKRKRPRYLLLENVKGLLSHNRGETFSIIIRSLDELGYDCQWQVCNSKNFGVPQNRERIFIIGHLRGQPRPEVFPIGESQQEDSRAIGQHISSRLDANYWKGPSATGQAKQRQFILAPTIRATEHKHGDNQTAIVEGDGRIRRLTPVECERLQGFPDNWTAGISDTQRYKCLGNAVTVNVVYEIMRAIEKGKV